MEHDAGRLAFYGNEAYEAVGAMLEADTTALFGQADIVLKVQRPAINPQLGIHEVDLMRPGSILLALLQPASSADLLEQLARRGISAFSMDLIPRISRAQDMDALSSMSTVSGYKAVLLAAARLPKFFPLLMTAAGTVTPARVFVLGAGVAGLQAIATARRLGALVQAFDVRPAVKEQVESLGATFVEAEATQQDAETAGGYATKLSEEAEARERELVARYVRDADVVITTALIPGKRAPILVTEQMVASMRTGSVVVDLAAEAQGNCELTQPGSEVDYQGVTIMGPLNLPSTMAVHASQLYSRNITRLAMHLISQLETGLDFDEQITSDTCVSHGGEVMWGRPSGKTVGATA